jgi:ankyrin repeat protein
MLAAACRFLAEQSAWVDQPDGADDTPLHLASRQGHAQVAGVLLARGAKAQARNERGLSALGEAIAGRGRGSGAGLGGERHGAPPRRGCRTSA